MSTAKAHATHRELLDKLSKQVSATMPIRTDSFDSEGNPVTILSQDATPAAGEKVVVIRTRPYPWPLSQDVFGNPAKRYVAHTVDICTERNHEGTLDNVNDILSPVELLPLIAEAVKTGAIVAWYRTANGTVPSVAAMTPANKAAEYGDLYKGLTSAA